jgi:hypothetical protein
MAAAIGYPWVDRQGNSPFVWVVLGAVAEVTSELELATEVLPKLAERWGVEAQAAGTRLPCMRFR